MREIGSILSRLRLVLPIFLSIHCDFSKCNTIFVFFFSFNNINCTCPTHFFGRLGIETLLVIYKNLCRCESHMLKNFKNCSFNLVASYLVSTHYQTVPSIEDSFTQATGWQLKQMADLWLYPPSWLPKFQHYSLTGLYTCHGCDAILHGCNTF